MLALVYLMDATLAPIGFLAVLASEVYEHAYLLAIAPAALLGLIARERSGRIARELELERAFRRSTRALDARAVDVRRQAGRVQSGDAEPEDRAAARTGPARDHGRSPAGRLRPPERDRRRRRASHAARHRRPDPGAGAAAELALGSPQANALAIGVGHSHVLAVMRAESPFSAVERDLLEHLAAQAAVTLENLRLEELMRRKEAELRAILEGVADGIAAEDPEGQLVFVNAAAARLLNGADSLGAALGIAPTLLPGRHVFEGEQPEPLVVKHAHRWSRVKAGPVLEGDRPAAGDQRRRGHHRDQAGRGGAAVPLRRLTRARGLAAARPHVAGGGSPRRGALRRRVRDRARRTARDRRRNRRSDAHPAAARRRAARWAAASITPPRASSRCGSGPRWRTLASIANARRSRTRSSSRCSHASCRRSRAWTAPRCTGRRARSTRSAATSTTCSRSARGEWFAVIGDVCGKGAEAAAVTALARYTIRAAVIRHHSPANVLRWLNEAMLRQHAGRFVTLACARIELGGRGDRHRRLRRPPAAARPARHRARGDARRATARSSACSPKIEATDQTARLAAGDALVLYTDGLTEARAPHVMTPGQLDNAVAGARRLDARGIVEHLSTQVPDPLRDDLALLAIRVFPSPCCRGRSRRRRSGASRARS